MNSRRRFICLDCGKDTGRMHEHYFIHTWLWIRAVPTGDGMLCVGCLEARIGRRLTGIDFPPVTVNSPYYEPKSARLMSRLNRGTTR